MQSDRRLSQRFKICSLAKLSDLDQNTSNTVTIENISDSGMGISSHLDIAHKETIFKVDIFHKDLNFELRGSTVWDNKYGHRNFYGVKFSEISVIAKEQINNVLNRKVENDKDLSDVFKCDVDIVHNILSEIEDDCFMFDTRGPSLVEQLEFIKNPDLKYKAEELTRSVVRVWGYIKECMKWDYEKYLEYFRDEILHFFVRDGIKINQHMYYKPLGYAGDYQMAKYFYNDSNGGCTTFDKFMWEYTLQNPLALAHRNRRTYFFDKIMQYMGDQKPNGEPILISSFGCGPAVEIIDVLSTIDTKCKVVFTCVDGESKALEEIKQDVEGIVFNKHVDWKVRLELENILNLVRGRTKLRDYNLQDFIYCAGFFDYLPDKIARKTVIYLLSLLDDFGKLVIVNVCGGDDVVRFFAEAIGKWYLHHRREEGMLELVKDIPGIKHVAVEYDKDTAKNMYLVISK